MQTHRFVQIDDLTTGQTFVRELMAEDAASIYSAEEKSQLARGETIRRDDKLHCDLQAFLRVNRHLPETRRMARSLGDRT